MIAIIKPPPRSNLNLDNLKIELSFFINLFLNILINIFIVWSALTIITFKNIIIYIFLYLLNFIIIINLKLLYYSILFIYFIILIVIFFGLRILVPISSFISRFFTTFVSFLIYTTSLSSLIQRLKSINLSIRYN